MSDQTSVDWLALLPFIRKVLSQTIATETGYPDLFVGILSPSRQLSGQHRKLRHQTLPYFLF